MPKSFSARAIVPVALAITGFVVVCCLLLYSVMKRDMTRDAVQHATNLADTIVKSTRYAMLKSDRETVGNIIRNIGDQQGVEHVRIFNKKGLVMFSAASDELNHFVDKKAEGCIGCHSGPEPITTLGKMDQARQFKNEKGRKVLAITAPVYNEPACYTAPCHVHNASQKVLGTLDIGLSQEPLQKTLITMGERMAVFTLMILALTIGGVAALLRRSVFVPLELLRSYAAELRNGNLETSPPPCEGELKEVTGTLQQMSRELRESRSRRE
ncbi:HAMP domain-containing protein [Geomobilimonas luticola]|uniref:HAMP domain-containing protein n=1 Tax=Geomobilimonas luticola TaxID=1114878 RepID=A0ABS5SB15_9BACT|nr:HAMP domain-containing protein [Geomobilimonas luticola]MBT0652370.1 HAMP domain-containing protein [Geomobilimonas luticola]